MTLSKNSLDEIGINIDEIRQCHNHILRVRPDSAPAETLQGIENEDQSPRLTLNEMVSPEPFYFYDYVNIDAFSWRQGEEDIQLTVYASFMEEKCQVKFVAHFLDSTTHAHCASIDLASCANTFRFTSVNKIALKSLLHDAKAERLTVIVECLVLDFLGRVTRLQLMKDIEIKPQPLDCAGFELAPVYTHIYPKKEETTVIFGDEKGYRLPTIFQHDENNIVISLRRLPEQSGDCDYVCNYDCKHLPIEYFPVLAIPAKGIIRLGRGVTINKTLRNKKALLERISAGGVASIPHDKFLPEIIENGTLQYQLDTDWGCKLRQEGNLTPQAYNFTLSFDVDYQLPAGAPQTVRFTLTSKTTERIRTGEMIQEPILPLKIMWGCLAKDTLITLSDGQLKRIDAMCVGDRVLSGVNKKVATVRNIWKGSEANIVLINAKNGRQLKATGSHPVYVKNDSGIELKRIQNITTDHHILVSDRQTAHWQQVESVQSFPCDDMVYNLSLDNDEGFYANGILVGDMNAQNAKEI